MWSKIFGWLFIVFGIIGVVSGFSSYLGWRAKEDDYAQAYVYNDDGVFSYQKNGETIIVETVYNTDEEIISLNVPDGQTAMMYCLRANPSECIYFNLDNSVDQGMLSPLSFIVWTLFMIGMGVFLINLHREDAQGTTAYLRSVKGTFLMYTFFLVLGLIMLGGQLLNTLKYLQLKNPNYLTTATIFSQIYHRGTTDNYKPVAYYYVDGEKYLHVNDTYINGNLAENFYTTFDIYYDPAEPGTAIKKENPVNWLLVVVGMSLVVISFPGVFLRNNLQHSLDRLHKEQQSQEWKI